MEMGPNGFRFSSPFLPPMTRGPIIYDETHEGVATAEVDEAENREEHGEGCLKGERKT